MNLPPAVIFVNSDELLRRVDGYYFTDGYYQDNVQVNADGYINDITRNLFERQLHTNETITFREFNDRVSVDPNYPEIVHLQGYRILVILPDFRDASNRNLADMTLFYSNGMVSVEKNNFGPPGLTLPLERLNIFTLLRDVGSTFVVILPVNASKPPQSLGGIVVSQLGDSSGVHDPNPDNIYNNPDFLNRK